VEDLIEKNNYSEAIEKLNYVLETANMFNFEEIRSIAFEKLKNLRDPEETSRNIRSILEFEFKNQRAITKAEMVNQLNIEISETDYYTNLLSSTINYEASETPDLERLGTKILKKFINPSLYDLIIQLEYDYKLAFKIGKFLLDRGFIKQFRNYPLVGEKVETGKKLEDLIIFISYATVDAEVFKVKDLASRLESFKEIKKVLYWQEDMKDNIIKYMSDNLGRCSAMILLCSENALDSTPVDKEWTAADMMGKPIIPVFLNPDHIPPLLKSRLGLEYDLVDFERNVVQLHNLILKKCV
ncbi:MAG: toll/interleukin-1 receptor domain-containing protein, partial [Promethearchaeota archaeon]